MGLFLCVLAVAFTVWMLPYFMGKNRKLQRRPDTDFVPAIVFTLVGLALAGLGGVLLMNNTAALTHALNIEQGVLGVAVIGVGLVLPEYVRVARKYWMNTQKPVSMHLTLATGNLGLLLMIGLSAVISPIIVTFAGAYLLLACVVAIIVFGILFYVGGEVGKIKAILFLAGFALVFVLLMKFSPDVRPLIIVADRRVAHALGTGAGDLVFAGHAVAHRAGLAVFADALPRIGQHFSIVHTESILLVFHFCGRKCPAAALSAPIIALFWLPVKGSAHLLPCCKYTS